VTHAAPSSPSTSAAPFVEKANAYLLPVYARPNFVLSHGKGSYVWDTDGRKYLDFCAGIAVNALGHADDEFVKVSIIQASVIALLYMRGS
jgi:acetylornithine aminotransferase